MSKKLWQAIGKWTNSTSAPPPQLEENLNDINRPSSNKNTKNCGDEAEEQYCPAGFLMESSHHNNSSARDDSDTSKRRKQSNISIEIQSCESKSLSSEADNKDIIPWYSSKFYIEKNFRKKVKGMNEQAKTLQIDISILRSDIGKEVETLKTEVLTTMNKFYNQFSKQHQKQMEMATCQKCEHSKAIIDLLTKQCWELEGMLKQKSVELERVNRLQLIHSREQNPMKKIENSLLQERGEAIKRLKAEVEELRMQNESLYHQLQTKEGKLKDLQNQYKNSLISFKSQIEAINESCYDKIQRAIQEKFNSQSQLRILHEKYQSMQQDYEQQQLKRNNKRYLTQLQQIGYSPSAIQLETAFNKHNSFKNDEALPYYPTRKTLHQNTNSLINLELTHSTQLHWDPPKIQKPLNAASYIPYSNTTRCFPSKNNTFDLSTKLKSKEYFQTTPESRKSRNTSERSFESAFQKLTEIQKDVRKEINRSKKSYK